jgi:hypothetical protein
MAGCACLASLSYQAGLLARMAGPPTEASLIPTDHALSPYLPLMGVTIQLHPPTPLVFHPAPRLPLPQLLACLRRMHSPHPVMRSSRQLGGDSALQDPRSLLLG